jgi:hypothetical protein
VRLMNDGGCFRMQLLLLMLVRVLACPRGTRFVFFFFLEDAVRTLANAKSLRKL